MKKSLWIALSALLMAGCASGETEDKCSNACDNPDTMTCMSFDSTKTWEPNGKPVCNGCTITQGTCVESGKTNPQPTTGVCGDGNKDDGEGCDDGNLVDGDGCSSKCEVEAPKAVCGDGNKDDGEGCDDGNQVDGDGCSSKCEVETSDPQCGNGTKESGEECDDGNTENGDGCSSECKNEKVDPKCGDNHKDDGEQCDGTDGVPSSCADWDSTKSWVDGTAKVSCSSTCELVTSNCVEARCGDNVKQDGEECDNEEGVPASCKAWKADAKWVSDTAKPACGQTTCKIVAGDCDEIVCGDGKINGDEVCDGVNAVISGTTKKLTEISCAEAFGGMAEYKDVKWMNGGHPGCSTTCGALDLGTCIPSTCGNGSLDAGEQCDSSVKGKTYTCADIDKDQEWLSGTPVCTNCKLGIGTCKSADDPVCKDGVWDKDKGEACDWNVWRDDKSYERCEVLDPDKYYGGTNSCSSSCVLDVSKCMAYCGNGTVDAGKGETCDWGTETSRKCSDVDKTKWKEGTATCKGCTLDTSKCVEGSAVTDDSLYYCQLMNPTLVEFNETKTTQAMTLRYGVGTGYTETNLKAELVYGADLTKVASWKTVPASQNAADDVFTASLGKSNFAAGENKLYYTFRISKDGGTNWFYCEKNETDDKTPKTDLTPIAVKDVTSHSVGTATLIESSSNVIFNFTFENTTALTGFNINTKGSNYSADSGSATLSGYPEGKTLTCANSGSCKVGGSGGGNALSINGWTSVKEDAIAAQKGFVVKTSTKGASSLDLSFEGYRSNATSSADVIAVLYSTDDGANWTNSNWDMKLDATAKTWKKVTIDMGSKGAGADSLSLLFIPYSSTGTAASGSNIRVDNITLTKK